MLLLLLLLFFVVFFVFFFLFHLSKQTLKTCNCHISPVELPELYILTHVIKTGEEAVRRRRIILDLFRIQLDSYRIGVT